MKKLLNAVVATIMTVSIALSVSSCGSEKMDISGAKSISDLSGARISAQSGTFHEDARKQISDVKGNLYEKFDQMLVALKSGAIDGYIAEEPTALSVCFKDDTLDYIHLVNNDTGFTATDADTALAVGLKKGSTLREQINSIIATISTEQQSELMIQMVKAYGGETISSLAVSNDAPSSYNGTLKVAMECEYAPYNWTQRDDSNGAVPISSSGYEGLYANGYDVQIAKYIANALGMKLEIYASSWGSLIAGVQAGTYDAIIAGMSPTAERAAEIDFTDRYYSSNLVVIYKK